MSNWGKCLGYTGTPCPNCGRYRLERYENGKEVCEKCEWCPQEGRYIDSEEMYPYDRDQYNKGFADGSRIDTTAIRAEVAREIFREIYAEIFEMFPLKVFRLIGGAYVEESFESGKERALHDVLNCIAELEKKYTEGKE